MKKYTAGLLICLAISIPAWFLGRLFPVVGGPVCAILIGMAIAPFIKGKELFRPGIAFTSKKILQYAVVLLGFGMNLSVVLEKGRQSLPIILATITTSILIAVLLFRLLKIPTKSAILIGVGSSICGGSAIAATAPVIEADDEEIAQSISVIFLFNIAAALIFPALGAALGLSNEGFGLFAGTAINDTSSVTAAAAAWDGIYGSNTLEAAAIVKLTRTLAITHHPVSGILPHKKRTERLRKYLSNRKNISVFRSVLPSRIRTDHRISSSRHGYGTVERFKQVLHHHGHGRHRDQYQPGHPRKNRNETDSSGPVLLDRNFPGQPVHAEFSGHLVSGS